MKCKIYKSCLFRKAFGYCIDKIEGQCDFYENHRESKKACSDKDKPERKKIDDNRIPFFNRSTGLRQLWAEGYDRKKESGGYGWI